VTGCFSTGALLSRETFPPNSPMPFTFEGVIQETTILCPQLEHITNGVVTCDGRMPTEKCTFQCDEGYDVIGNFELTCLDDGSWNGEVPYCIISCPFGYERVSNNTCVILECDPLV